jgi:hypothetical protein
VPSEALCQTTTSADQSSRHTSEPGGSHLLHSLVDEFHADQILPAHLNLKLLPRGSAVQFSSDIAHAVSRLGRAIREL